MTPAHTGPFGTSEAVASVPSTLAGTVAMDSHQLSMPVALGETLHSSTHAARFPYAKHHAVIAVPTAPPPVLTFGGGPEFASAVLALLLMIRSGRNLIAVLLSLLGALIERCVVRALSG